VNGFGRNGRSVRSRNRRTLGSAENAVMKSIAESNISNISVKSIIKEVIKKNPKLLWDLKDLFI